MHHKKLRQKRGTDRSVALQCVGGAKGGTMIGICA
jgi:hypothetical protein